MNIFYLASFEIRSKANKIIHSIIESSKPLEICCWDNIEKINDFSNISMQKNNESFNNIILVFLDSTFVCSTSRMQELTRCIDLAQTQNAKLLPILIDDCVPPAEVNNYDTIHYSSTSETVDQFANRIKESVVGCDEINYITQSQTLINDLIKKYKRYSAIAGVVLFLLFGVALYFTFGYERNSNTPEFIDGLPLYWGIITAITYGLMYLKYTISLDAIKTKNIRKNFTRNIWAVKGNGFPNQSRIRDSEVQNNYDVLKLMLINLDEMNSYYLWGRAQAKSAFYFAIFTSIVGFILIVSSLVLYIVLKKDTDALFIQAISGVLSEFIAVTTILIYRKSITQLGFYYKFLHDDELFLSKISLLEKIESPTLRDELLSELVRKDIN